MYLLLTSLWVQTGTRLSQCVKQLTMNNEQLSDFQSVDFLDCVFRVKRFSCFIPIVQTLQRNLGYSMCPIGINCSLHIAN